MWELAEFLEIIHIIFTLWESGHPERLLIIIVKSIYAIDNKLNPNNQRNLLAHITTKYGVTASGVVWSSCSLLSNVTKVLFIFHFPLLRIHPQPGNLVSTLVVTCGCNNSRTYIIDWSYSREMNPFFGSESFVNVFSNLIALPGFHAFRSGPFELISVTKDLG